MTRYGWTKKNMREVFGPRDDGEYVELKDVEIVLVEARASLSRATIALIDAVNELRGSK